MIRTYGIHHVTSIVGPAQENIDFNAGILGLRLLKKTLNYDDRYGYHFYFGNDKGNTGITTTFPTRNSRRGTVGGGQVGSVQYAIRPGQSEFWEERLKTWGLEVKKSEIMTQEMLALKDPSGLHLEMVETEEGPASSWSFNGVAGERAVTGIHSASLSSVAPEETLKVLTEVMGYSIVSEDEEYYRLKVHDGLGGELYLNKTAAERGRHGTGTVHHIAFSIKDDEIEAWRELLDEKGYRPTDIRERKYFRSIYFREKGGILFEFATEGPGFLVDEDEEHLGEKLMIPSHYQKDEEEILKVLEPAEVREVKAPGKVREVKAPARSGK